MPTAPRTMTAMGQVPERRLVQLRKAKSRNARVDDPDSEVLRRYIDAGICWWCLRGAFKSLAVHTSHVHGISADDLREMAVLFKSTPICSPEFSEHCVERNKARGPSCIPTPPGKGHKKNLNRAARTAYTARLIAYNESIGPKAVLEIKRKAGQARAAQMRMPHPCSVCGQEIPTRLPLTCSPECRRVVRVQTGKASGTTKPCSPICIAPGCGRPGKTKDLCTKHYQRMRYKAAQGRAQ